jgi:hypothetical protein
MNFPFASLLSTALVFPDIIIQKLYNYLLALPVAAKLLLLNSALSDKNKITTHESCPMKQSQEIRHNSQKPIRGDKNVSAN